METPAFDGLVERLVPNVACLFHAIEAFYELHNPVLFARCFKAMRLFHEHGFIGREYAMEEGCFDVEVLDVPVKGGSEVENSAEGF